MKKTIIFVLFVLSISVHAENIMLSCQVEDFGIESIKVIQDDNDLIGWTGLVTTSMTGKSTITGIDSLSLDNLSSKGLVLFDEQDKSLTLYKNKVDQFNFDYFIVQKLNNVVTKSVLIDCQ